MPPVWWYDLPPRSLRVRWGYSHASLQLFCFKEIISNHPPQPSSRIFGCSRLQLIRSPNHPIFGWSLQYLTSVHQVAKTTAMCHVVIDAIWRTCPELKSKKTQPKLLAESKCNWYLLDRPTTWVRVLWARTPEIASRKLHFNNSHNKKTILQVDNLKCFYFGLVLQPSVNSMTRKQKLIMVLST